MNLTHLGCLLGFILLVKESKDRSGLWSKVLLKVQVCTTREWRFVIGKSSMEINGIEAAQKYTTANLKDLRKMKMKGPLMNYIFLSFLEPNYQMPLNLLIAFHIHIQTFFNFFLQKRKKSKSQVSEKLSKDAKFLF